MVQHVGDNAKDFTTEYGNIAAASIGAIQRGLLTLEEQGAMFSSANRCSTSPTSCGSMAMAAASSTFWQPKKLILSPALYSTFLLWLLSELSNSCRKPATWKSLAWYFSSMRPHLLFNDAPTALVDKVEQVVRLIRSKGVGVYFVTQNPLDVPDKILGQLGNRVQHAPCALSRLGIRRRFRRPPKPCAPIPSSMPRR